MSIQRWSDDVRVVELQEDPAFTDDISGLMEQAEQSPTFHVVLNFSALPYLNSSNIARLLKLRKLLLTHQRRMVVCNVDTQVWSMFLVTGLEKVFEFSDNLDTALLSVQLAKDAT